METIHSTAVIDPAAELGKDVRVGPYSVIEGDVTIGDRCLIGPRVSLLAHTTLGSGCRIHANAVLGDIPQDTGFDGATTYLRVGNDTIIREGASIHRGTSEGTATVVGDRCMLMSNSHLAHNVELGNDVNVVSGALLGGYVVVGDRAFISGNCVIHQFVRIGRIAMISGGCGVTKDVPPFTSLQPVCLNTIGGLNVVGMRRAGLSAPERQLVKDAFRILFLSGLTISQAVARVRESLEGDLIVEICDFIEASRRGVCSGRRMQSEGE
jgi:UDP-N-acetylglucosamine acyltransferase